ncbi:MAG: mechanosensitive ion channel [Planctomycetaceae bacterium]|jgi:small conductance mechanosensitive channel|nr:mechanosensitive ion channel [Planctomycetaceae bacterium]
MNWFLLAAPTTEETAEKASAIPSSAELLELAQDKGLEFGENLILAIVIFFVGRIAAKILKRVIEGVMRRAKFDETLLQFLGNIALALMMTFVCLASLDMLGVNTTSLAAILAAAGLAVGLALQGSLSNFAAGVMLILFRPFKVGDFIEAGGTAGVVDEIHIFHTLMRTSDNRKIVVPNSQITEGNITNNSAMPTRRIDITVQCGYNDDLTAVKYFLWEVIRSDERILQDPEPFVGVTELAASGVNILIRPWTKSEDFWLTKCDLTERIKLGFDERGFTIPYPTQEIHIHRDSNSQ